MRLIWDSLTRGSLKGNPILIDRYVIIFNYCFLSGFSSQNRIYIYAEDDILNLFAFKIFSQALFKVTSFP